MGYGWPVQGMYRHPNYMIPPGMPYPDMSYDQQRPREDAAAQPDQSTPEEQMSHQPHKPQYQHQFPHYQMHPVMFTPMGTPPPVPLPRQGDQEKQANEPDTPEHTSLPPMMPWTSNFPYGTYPDSSINIHSMNVFSSL